MNKNGGVIIMLRDGLKYTKVSKINDLSVELHFEIAALRIDGFGICVLNIYRSPHGSIVTFIELMEKALDSANVTNNIIITGDFNVKFCSNDTDAQAVLDCLRSHGFVQKVHDATRGSNCIDNVFVNFCCDNSEARVGYKFSDHNSIDLCCKKYRTQTDIPKTIRPITERGMFNFFQLISEIGWDFILDNRMDVNSKFNIFLQLLSDKYNIAFPEYKTKKQ